MEKQKLNELFILTSFLCCFVVMIHLSSYPVNLLTVGSWQHKIFFLGNKALSFVVPGFVFLSGLKLTYLYREKDFVFSDFMKKRFSKILIPYVFWYIAYTILFRLLGYAEAKTLIQHLFSFFMGDLVSPFYFITIIFQFYLLFGLILFLFKKYSHRTILLLSVVVEFFYLEYIYLPYEDRFFLTYLLYFVLGCYVAFHLDGFRKFLQKGEVFLCGSYLFLTLWHIFHAYDSAVNGTPYAYWRVITCLFSLSAIFVYYQLSMTLQRIGNEKGIMIFRKMDEASYLVFLSHCFFIYLCNGFLSRLGLASVTGRFILNTLVVFPVVFGGVFLWQYAKKRRFQSVFVHGNP